jgi:hypothetical protein
MKNLFRGSLLAGAGFLLVAQPAQADRMTSLMGNHLFEDADDVFAFPQLLQTYQNTLTFDVGTTSGDGNGLFTLGNKTHSFGLAVRRDQRMESMLLPSMLGEAMFGANLGAPSNALDDFEAANTMVDLMYARSLNSAMSMGLRLSVGNGLAYQSVSQTVGDTTTTIETSSEQNTFSLTAGLDYTTRAIRLNTAFYFANASGAAGKKTGSNNTFGLNLRGYYPMGTHMDLGFFGGFGSMSGFTQDATPDPAIVSTDANSAWSIGAGPRIRVPDGATVGVYAVLQGMAGSADPNNSTEVTSDNVDTGFVTMPGLRMAAEVPLGGRWTARSGLQYTFNQNTMLAAGGDFYQRNRGTNFGWNAGLGMKVNEHLTLDGTLNHGLLWSLQGRDLFAVFSAKYNFGNATMSGGKGRAERIERQRPAREVNEDRNQDENEDKDTY